MPVPTPTACCRRRDVVRPDDGAVGGVDEVEASVAHERAVDEPVGGVRERQHDQVGRVHGRRVRRLGEAGEGVVGRQRGHGPNLDVLVDPPEERNRLVAPHLAGNASAVDRHAVEVLGQILVNAVRQQTVDAPRHDDQVAGSGHRVDGRGVDGAVDRFSVPWLGLGSPWRRVQQRHHQGRDQEACGLLHGRTFPFRTAGGGRPPRGRRRRERRRTRRQPMAGRWSLR